MKHIPPDSSWNDEAQLKLWRSQMDEWHKQNPKAFMQENASGFGFLIFAVGVITSIALGWNGFEIFPMPEILGAIFGYFAYQDKDDAQRKWNQRKETFAKNAQDFIRTNRVTVVKVPLLEFPHKQDSR